MGAENPLAVLDREHRDLVLGELERILNSPAFRGSKRSQEFLRYVVTNALDHRTDLLKERSIGIEIFGRPADYDTGEDSIVRVKASEVRKRLAQHYMEAGAGRGVQIEIPAGAYTAEFRFIAPAAAPAKTPARRWWIAGGIAAAAVALLAGGVAYFTASPKSALDGFWEPVMRSRQPVLLCVAHPAVYSVSGKTRQALALPPEQRPPEVPTADIARLADHYVGVGDAMTLAALARFFAGRKKASQIRMGTDTSFTDLRNSPAVLIGAYTNQWTMQVTDDLRYVFDRENGTVLVRDRMNAAQRWVYDRTATPPSDYAIVSRLFDSKTGEAVVVAAGLSHFGTQMAGEFLTNPGYLEQAVRGAPADWRTRNLQLVLRAEVIGKTPGPPKLAASWFW